MSPIFTGLWIDGNVVPSSTNDTFEVKNPFSNEIVGISASASSEDCNAAVEAAARAFKTWEHTSVSERRAIFHKAADILASEKYKNLALCSVREETATIDSWAMFNWHGSVRMLREAASAIKDLKGTAVASDAVPGAHVFTHRRAHGVVLGIAPWNAPLSLSFRAVAIPIICGNTVILKSSECSPRSQVIVAQVFHEAGLPNGVLNFISMSRENSPALTAQIIAHPAVRKINFTGSDRVGKLLAMEAAKYLKPCVFELGGKAPVVVLDDANISEASRAIVSGALLHSGQICMSTERVIVQRGAYPALLAAVKDLSSKIKAGDPANDATSSISALFSAGSAENVLNYLREAKEAGGEVVLGDMKRSGAVIQPHIVTRVKPGMTLWDRETFGPVMVIVAADSVDEAVELANASDYTLTAALWTNNLNVALDVAGRIRAGCTNINGSSVNSDPAAPLFGLGGATGYGCFDVENFTDKRAIIVHPPGRQFPLVS